MLFSPFQHRFPAKASPHRAVGSSCSKEQGFQFSVTGASALGSGLSRRDLTRGTNMLNPMAPVGIVSL